MESGMEMFRLTKKFPSEERLALVEQLRRSSRSVCANTVEVQRKRKYGAAFISKINNDENDANETQAWLEIVFRCKYINLSCKQRIENAYNKIPEQLFRMIEGSGKWILNKKYFASH